MMCQRVYALPTGEEWSYEVRWSGSRAIGLKTSEGASLHPSEDFPSSTEFCVLVKALEALKCQSAILDGVIIALGFDDRTGAQLTPQRRREKGGLGLVLFDLLAKDGRDFTSHPFEYRRTQLRQLLPSSPGTLSVAETLPSPYHNVIKAAKRRGLTGVVAKHKRSAYLPGEKSKYWLEWLVE